MNILCRYKRARFLTSFFVVSIASIVSSSLSASAITLVVPGTSNPFLAGLPNGSTDNLGYGDSAPAQSPVQVTGIPIIPGTSLTFSATGGVNNGGSVSINPDGISSNIINDGSQNGISGYSVPLDSLIGIFLSNNLPTFSVAPSILDFSTASKQGYTNISPSLQQVFFIGDGLTGTGSGNQQSVIVPNEATRLFLASVDGYEWSNNTGQFNINVQVSYQSTAVPEPFTIIGTLVGGTAAFKIRRKLRIIAK